MRRLFIAVASRHEHFRREDTIGRIAGVDVREARFGTWRVTENSLPAEKLSATEVRFRVSVPAGGEATLTYTVQAES